MSEISPLFALHAEEFLEKGDADSAIELCLKGLQEYPDYTSAYSVLAKAQKIAGKKEEAEKTIRRAEERFPASKVIPRYKQNLNEFDREIRADINVSAETDGSAEKLQPRGKMEFLRLFQDKKEYQDGKIKASDVNLIPGLNFSPIRMAHFVAAPEDHIEKLPVPPAFPEIPAGQDVDYKKELENQKEVFSDIVSRADAPSRSFVSPAKHKLSDIAQKLNDLSSPVKRSENSGNKESSFVTETIAGIYESQGAYREAIEAYTDLAGKFPEKEEYYGKKISDIKAKL